MARIDTITTHSAQRPTIRQLLSRTRSRLIVNVALLLLSLVMLGVAALQMRGYEDGITRTSFTLQQAIPLPVLKFTPAHNRGNVVAVIVHGYSADKEMMSGLAVDLARAGVTTYTYDLPGHGASTAPYGAPGTHNVVPRLVSSLGEVVDYALAHAYTPHPRLVLIGYSIGTIAAGEYALQHPELSTLQATVLVAGVLNDQPTPSNPRNLLVLSGQFDLPGINDISRKLIASGCDVPVARVDDSYSCAVAASQNQTGMRQREVLPGLDHISIITAGSTHTMILQWLGATVDPSITSNRVVGDARIHWMLFGLFGAALGALALIGLGSTWLRLAPAAGEVTAAATAHAEHSPSRRALWPRLGVIAGALAIGLAAMRWWLPTDFWLPEPAPFGFIQQQVSGDVALLLLVAGVVLWAAVRFVPGVRSLAEWPARSRILPQVALAGAVAVFLYFTLGKISSFGWESLALSPARLWRAGVYVLMIWPFFCAVQALLAGYARRTGRGARADLAATLLIVASFMGAILLNFGRLSYLGILLPVVAILLLAFIGLSAWTRRAVGMPVWLISGAQALLMGWLLAATLPLLG
ncbi:MAG TPA: alpha/beta fold hydrolase [Ktedonobacterales bacterium]